AAPKGATPSFSKAANFSRRSASNSLSVCSMPGSDSKQNQSNEQIEWVARASRVLVSASRRNNLFNIRVQSLMLSREKRSFKSGGVPKLEFGNEKAVPDRELGLSSRRRSVSRVSGRLGSRPSQLGALMTTRVCLGTVS